MEGSDAPLVGLVDPPRYPPRPRGDTSGRDPRIVLWGRVGAPLALAILRGRGRSETPLRLDASGILSFLTSFLPASLSTIPTNQQRSKSEADAESKVCVLLTF